MLPPIFFIIGRNILPIFPIIPIMTPWTGFASAGRLRDGLLTELGVDSTFPVRRGEEPGRFGYPVPTGQTCGPRIRTRVMGVALRGVTLRPRCGATAASLSVKAVQGEVVARHRRERLLRLELGLPGGVVVTHQVLVLASQVRVLAG